MPQHRYNLYARFRFVIAPCGGSHAAECESTWDALYAGAIPIVRRVGCPADRLWEGLPVLVVSSYVMPCPHSVLSLLCATHRLPLSCAQTHTHTHTHTHTQFANVCIQHPAPSISCYIDTPRSTKAFSTAHGRHSASGGSISSVSVVGTTHRKFSIMPSASD